MPCSRLSACEDCSKCCNLLHQKQKNQSPVVARFFKIMFGKDFDKVLFLPPKFARTVKDLEGKETQLEDASGKKWPVKFSLVNGSLAVKEGWPKFFEHHHLEIGDLLVFNYIKGSHFVVHTFDTSACEIFEFKNWRRPRQNKKSRKNPETIVEEEPIQKMDLNFADKPNSTTIPPGSGSQNVQSDSMAVNASNFDCDYGQRQAPQPSQTMELDPIFMLDRNGVCYQEDRNFFLYDLSNFEMEKNISNAGSERALETTPASFTDQTEAKGDDVPMAVVQTHTIDGICVDEFHDKPSDESNLGERTTNEVSEFQNDERSCTVPDGNNSISPSDTESHSLGSAPIAEHESASIPMLSDSSALNPMLNDQFGFQNKKTMPFTDVKKENVESGEQTPGFSQVSYGNLRMTETDDSATCSPIVKTEPNTNKPCATSQLEGAFSAEVKSLSYLDIPVCISLRGRVVYLRDPFGRLRPVLYAALLYKKVLSDGWEKFCEVNSIKCGDICKFRPESPNPCIFKVDIIHKSGSSIDN